MSNKTKGSKNERELYQMFVDNHYRAVRVAGSGTMENADCDIIAGKKGKKFAIEVKSCKKLPKYISKDQVNRFMTFSEIFGLKPVIAIRINRIGWIFLNPREGNKAVLKDSGKNWAINQEIIEKKGIKFAQFFGEKIKGKQIIKEDKSLKKVGDMLIDEKELDNLTAIDY